MDLHASVRRLKQLLRPLANPVRRGLNRTPTKKVLSEMERRGVTLKDLRGLECVEPECFGGSGDLHTIDYAQVNDQKAPQSGLYGGEWTHRVSAAVAPLLGPGAFFRSVLLLASGSALGQLIVVTALPILTRLFDPAAFGVLGT